MRKTFRSEKYSLAKTFHINTKLNIINKNNFEAHFYNDIPSKKHYVIKSYPLKVDSNRINLNLVESIQARKSHDFIDKSKKVDVTDLGTLLFYSYCQRRSDNTTKFTPTPSAGGRYPAELYIIPFHLNGVEDGLYHYNTLNYSLDLIKIGDLKQKLRECIPGFPEYVENSGFVVITAITIDHTCAKYGDRGYKLICMDIGHISQNFYLLSASQNLGCRAVFGFIDDRINELIDLDGFNDSVFLVHFFSKL